MNRNSAEIRWAAAMATAFCLTAAAHAASSRLPQTEEAFVQEFGNRAVTVADGVYRIAAGPHETIEVSYGAAGLAHDLVWMKEQIADLRFQLRGKPADRNLQARLKSFTTSLRLLSQAAGGSEKSAASGQACSGFFNYTLDGGVIGYMATANVWGTADISTTPYLQNFPSNYRPPHRAYVSVVAQDDIGNTYSQIDTYLEDQGSLATASASANVGCGIVFDCPSWLSFDWVYGYTCTDGYHRIYRTKYNPNDPGY